MYYGNRTEWSASEQSVIMRLINQEVDRPICFSTRMITGTIEFDDRKQKLGSITSRCSVKDRTRETAEIEPTQKSVTSLS